MHNDTVNIFCCGTRRRPLLGSMVVVALTCSATLLLNAQRERPVFSNVTDRAGLTFTHHNGAAGDKWYPELFGGGVVVLDIDGDGGPICCSSTARTGGPAVSRPRHGLFRNNHDGTFKDVLAGSGLDAAERLRHRGNGRRLRQRRPRRCVHDDGGWRAAVSQRGRRSLRRRHRHARAFTTRNFAVSAAWLDYDRDGLADLFIGNYVQWSPGAEVLCAQNGVKGYCGPECLQAHGAEAVSQSRAAAASRMSPLAPASTTPTDKAMGVAVLDYNGDGWPDVFVGSDRVPAKLYRNDGQGRFVDEARALPAWRSARTAPRAPTWAWTPPTTTARAVRTSSSATSSTRCSASTTTRTARRSSMSRRDRKSGARACCRSRGPCSFSTTISTDFSTSSPSTAAPTSRRGWTRARGSASRRCCCGIAATARSKTSRASLGAVLQPTDHGSRRGVRWISMATAISIIVVDDARRPGVALPQRRRQSPQVAARAYGRDDVEHERPRHRGARDERVGHPDTDGPQRVELRVAERADVDVRSWPAIRACPPLDRRVAVGQDSRRLRLAPNRRRDDPRIVNSSTTIDAELAEPQRRERVIWAAPPSPADRALPRSAA